MPKLNCRPTQAVLKGNTGQNRVNRFRQTNKYRTLDQVTYAAVHQKADPFYELDLDRFQELLSKFKADKYNGVRVHIACYPDAPNPKEKDYVPVGKEGQLTLFFVPTTAADVDTGEDDRTQFWHLGTDGKLTSCSEPGTVPADEDFVTNWIKHYREHRLPALEQDGKNEKGNAFLETHSLWYKIETIAGNGTSNEIGLLSFLDCARSTVVNPTNNVTALYIQWAAFLDDGEDDPGLPQYQLSLIFHLLQKGDKPPTKDVSIPVEINLSFGSQKPLGEIESDTGIPCPPADNCTGGFDPENP